MVLPLLPELCASAVVASSATLSETRISVSTTTLHVLESHYSFPHLYPRCRDRGCVDEVWGRLRCPVFTTRRYISLPSNLCACTILVPSAYDHLALITGIGKLDTRAVPFPFSPRQVEELFR